MKILELGTVPDESLDGRPEVDWWRDGCDVLTWPEEELALFPPPSLTLLQGRTFYMRVKVVENPPGNSTSNQRAERNTINCGSRAPSSKRQLKPEWKSVGFSLLISLCFILGSGILWNDSYHTNLIYYGTSTSRDTQEFSRNFKMQSFIFVYLMTIKFNIKI